MTKFPSPPSAASRIPAAIGFTLVELLMTTAILLIVMAVLLQLTGNVFEVWNSNSGKIAAFQTARGAFTTINRTVARATLNTYYDYVDDHGNYRNEQNASSFRPSSFARTSELHFLSGPAAEIVPEATGILNPGHALFFQAPLGETDNREFSQIQQTLNSVGFHLQYDSIAGNGLLPDWLSNLASDSRRFQLLQIVEPTEKLRIYNSTSSPVYNLHWLDPFKTSLSTPRTPDQPRPHILAEDTLLLLVRPRLSAEDEATIAPELGGSYSETLSGSILCPNYHYDSRAWQSGYPTSARVTAAASPAVRTRLMRNQAPPIVELVLVCADRQTLSRLNHGGDAPPAPAQIPASLFQDSAKLDADLQIYSEQLSQAKIRHRVFRNSVEVQGAKWSASK